MLQHALDDRSGSRQLHKLLPPVHTLPIEVLSLIFQQVISSNFLEFDDYRACLHQAFRLSCVSAHFRHVALGTSELWKRLPLYLFYVGAIGQVLSLLRHCIALAPYVNISVFSELDEEETRSAIKVLLTSDTMRKVKAFELHYCGVSSKLWLERLKFSPILDTLSIVPEIWEDISLNLRTLKTMTRLRICGPCPDLSILVPPSVQYLAINSSMSQQIVTSLLQQCPNLVELYIDPSIYDVPDGSTQLTQTLTFNYLEKLTLGPIKTIDYLQLPSLKSLQFDHEEANGEFIGVILLCRNVSLFLTNLTINTDSGVSLYDELYQLCRLPFPQLVKLEFGSFYWECVDDFIRALAPLDAEYNNPERSHFPSLKSVSVCCENDVAPLTLLHSLQEWGIGEGLYFHFKIDSSIFGWDRWDQRWSPDVEEEFRSFVSSRRVEVRWRDHQVTGVVCEE